MFHADPTFDKLTKAKVGKCFFRSTCYLKKVVEPPDPYSKTVMLGARREQNNFTLSGSSITVLEHIVKSETPTFLSYLPRVGVKDRVRLYSWRHLCSMSIAPLVQPRRVPLILPTSCLMLLLRCIMPRVRSRRRTVSKVAKRAQDPDREIIW